MTPNEQRDVEQALAIGDKINDFILAMKIKPTARIQFIAHLISALALADANGVPFTNVITTLRKINDEMSRTKKMPKKPTLTVLPTGVEEMARAQNERNNADKE